MDEQATGIMRGGIVILGEGMVKFYIRKKRKNDVA